jgi:hypothetical protein
MIDIEKEIDRARLIKYICFVGAAVLLLLSVLSLAPINLADAGAAFIIGKFYESDQLAYEVAYAQITETEEESETSE